METFLEEVNKKINGVPLQRCYHCRKCTAGCPMTRHMEYNPNKVIKMIQNGQRDKSAEQFNHLDVSVVRNLHYPLSESGGHRQHDGCAQTNGHTERHRP